MPQTVTHAYLMGIREGREFWQLLEREGRANLESARECLGNVRECLAMGFAGEIRDMMKGEQAFWEQRIKLLIEQRAREGVAA